MASSDSHGKDPKTVWSKAAESFEESDAQSACPMSFPLETRHDDVLPDLLQGWLLRMQCTDFELQRHHRQAGDDREP